MLTVGARVESVVVDVAARAADAEADPIHDVFHDVIVHICVHGLHQSHPGALHVVHVVVCAERQRNHGTPATNRQEAELNHGLLVSANCFRSSIYTRLFCAVTSLQPKNTPSLKRVFGRHQ